MVKVSFIWDIFIGLSICCNSLYSVTTVSPDQPSMSYLDPEAQAVGFSRDWLLSVKSDPVIAQALQKAELATPEQARDLWLDVANQEAEQGKANEVLYCLYKRLPFMEQWNTVSYQWSFLLDLGTKFQQRTDKLLPSNPLSIGIKMGAVELIDSVMPKASDFVQGLLMPQQTAIMQVCIELLMEAIRSGQVTLVSVIIGKMKGYNLWTPQLLQPFKERMLKSAQGKTGMEQLLAVSGI